VWWIGTFNFKLLSPVHLFHCSTFSAFGGWPPTATAANQPTQNHALWVNTKNSKLSSRLGIDHLRKLERSESPDSWGSSSFYPLFPKPYPLFFPRDHLRKRLQKIRIFSNIFKRFASFFEYFQIFSNVFEYFQTFSNVSILPKLPNRYNLTRQSLF